MTNTFDKGKVIPGLPKAKAGPDFFPTDQPRDSFEPYNVMKDRPVFESYDYQIDRKDVVGHEMRPQGTRGSEAAFFCRDTSLPGLLSVDFRSGFGEGRDGFVVISRNELDVLCQETSPVSGESMQVFKPVNEKNRDGDYEMILGGTASPGQRYLAIFRERRGDGTERCFKIDGTAVVWDAHENNNFSPVFFLHTLKK